MKKAFLIALGLALLLTGCTGTTPTPTQSQPNLSVQQKAAAEAEIRYAIGLLLDRNYISGQIGQAGQVPASSFVPTGMTDADGTPFYQNAGHNPDYIGYYDVSEEAYEENCAQALAILSKYYPVDSSGKLVGFPTLTYLYNTSESHKAIGEYLQSALAVVGIPVNLENQEWNAFLSTRQSGDFTLARSSWLADYNDPICFLDMWTSHSGNNDIRFGRDSHAGVGAYSLDLTPYGLDIAVENGTWAQTYDVLIDAIKHCRNREDRYEMMHLAEDMLMETGCIMPIYFYTDVYLLSEQVEGFYTNPLGYKFFSQTRVGGSTDTLSVCLASEPESLDPALNSTVDGATLVSHLFSGLAKWDKDGQTAVLAADCAQDLPAGVENEDGSVTYTYTLKENLKWSDGQPLTAEDFVFAWKRAAASQTGADFGYLLGQIRGYPNDLQVFAPDERTLQVTLENDLPYWNELLAFPTFFPVRKDVVENDAWATSQKTYVSNGQYTMTGWTHNSVITLQKNPHYQDASQVSMHQIKFYLSDDANNMLTNFKNGAWQLVDDVPTNELAALKKSHPQQLKTAEQIGTYYLTWNITKPLLP